MFLTIIQNSKTTLMALFKNKTATVKGDNASINAQLSSLTEVDASFEIVPHPSQSNEIDAQLHQQVHTHHAHLYFSLDS